MKKKAIVLLFALCVAQPFFALGGQEKAPQGQQAIRVLLAEHPTGDIIKDRVHEFEAATGISVTVVPLPEAQLSQQLAAGFSTGSLPGDVFMMRPLQEGLMFAKNGWCMTLSDFDFSDFPAAAVELATYGGKPYFVPIVIEWEVLYYRKDLLKAAGVAPPSNMDELMAAAALLTTDDVAGIASRGAGAAAVTQLSSYVYNFGGRYLSEDNGRAVFNSSDALTAIRFYGALLNRYGPPGVTAMSWEEIVPLFRAGKVALWTDASVFYGAIVNPQGSNLLAENVGVAPFPAGPAGNTPFCSVGWGLAISSGTKSAGAAMSFLEWATSVEVAKEALRRHITVARNSAWQDLNALSSMNSELARSRQAAVANGVPYDRPHMSSAGVARELIGELITESINTAGESRRLRDMANEKVKAVNELLRAAGEYKE